MKTTLFTKNVGYSGSMMFFFTNAFKQTRFYILENIIALENRCHQGGFFFDTSIGDLFITINILNSSFVNNFAEGFGAAMRTSFNSIYVKIFYNNCKFLNNTSVRFGGAIALKTTSGTVRWLFSEFNNNTVLEGKGGAIFGSCLSYTLIQTFRCVFINNWAQKARHIYIIIGERTKNFFFSFFFFYISCMKIP
jgi:predicted outer membrane repeat protein